MKKILFRKLLIDCLTFFFVTLLSASVIIWVFQAVNFLDIMIEDGRDYIVYMNYSLLNFPKILSKVLPFVFFFSFFYVITKYELNNELIIFWNFGVHKIELINFFFKFSVFLMIIQIVLTAALVPFTQSTSRSLIKNSSVDFFESFVKPKKFNDNIRGLTIYADSKDENGNLKNIYLKKDSGKKKYQITVAKRGEFKSIGKSKILVLYDGQTLNVIDKKVTNFKFSKSDFTLSSLDSDVIIQNKIQETSTVKLFECLNKYFDKNLKLISDPPIEFLENCSLQNLDNIFQELYKRFIIPFYLPVLILTSLLLILKSKESSSYGRFKIVIFFIGLLIIISSESSLKFVKNNFYENIFILIIPILVIIYMYFLFRFKLIFKTKSFN